MFVCLLGICHSNQRKFPYNSQITIPTDACFPLHLPTFDKDNTTDRKEKKNYREKFNAMVMLISLVVYNFSQNIIFSTPQKSIKRGFLFKFVYHIFL